MASVIIGDYEYQRVGVNVASATAVDKTKSSYGEIRGSVDIEGNICWVRYLNYCFQGCTSLTEAPVIPNSVTNMDYCFEDCSSLKQAPVIPNNVTDMLYCFRRCRALTEAPVIPNNVTSMDSIFWGCTSLTQAPAIPRGVTNMNDCFALCYRLRQAPIIPNSVVDMSGCFRKTSITQAPVIPNGVQTLSHCFFGCSNLEQPPTIPSSVTNMSYCFSSCLILEQAPAIPNGVTDISHCFDTTPITQAPEIPSSVTNMNYCFNRCTSLSGNVVVNNAFPNSFYRMNVFKDTVNDIYIVNNGLGEADWKEIASQFANVHYEADDNPIPNISDFTATRVSAVGSTDYKPTGLYAYIKATAMVYDNLIPVGWTNELKGEILTDNGTVESVTWQPSQITEYPTDIWCWISLGDTSVHTITLQISDRVKEGATEIGSKSSNVLSITIPKSYALVDYYHDEVTGEEGMSIGKYAEFPNLLDIDMPVMFRQWTNIGGGAPIGSIVQYGGAVEPDGWFVCNGRELSRDTYADLFNAIGTTYGSGDGSTTFNIPDFRGRTAIGVSTDHAIGSSGGEEEHTLTTDETPAHTHGNKSLTGGISMRRFGTSDGQSCWANGIMSVSQHSQGNSYNIGVANTQNKADTININASHEHNSVGGSQSHNNMQPYLTSNYIIKWKNVSSSQTGITVEEMADLLRPIGTVYKTHDGNFNPNTSWGGTWELLPEGYVLLSGSKSGSYKVGDDTSTGSGFKEYGSNTHTLTVNEMPSHNHNAQMHYNAGSGSSYAVEVTSSAVKWGWQSNRIQNTGGGRAHNIMQKSIAVYWWIRTA